MSSYAVDVPLPASVTLVSGAGGLPALQVRSAHCTGEIYLDGALVSAWAPVGAEPVVWMTRHAEFLRGHSVHGGIPLCAPWFGNGPAGDRNPGHGFIRLARWELRDVRDDGERVTVRLTLAGGDVEGVPTAYARSTFELVVGFGRELELALTIAAGTEPVAVEAALHTYVGVGDVRQVVVHGLEGHGYFDKVIRALARQDDGPLVLTGEIDRVYDCPTPVTVDDPVLDRRVTVTGRGAANVVVWNPWAEKSAGIDGFGPDEWIDMVCVETANALDHAVALAAGEAMTIATTIAVG